LNILSKIGLIIIVASLSTLCGNSLTVFGRSWGSSYPPLQVVPETYAGFCQFLVSYNYTISINSNATVEFMVIPFNQLFEQYGRHNDHAIASVVVDNWGKLTFRPDRRGIYALVFMTADSETTCYHCLNLSGDLPTAQTIVSFSMLTTRVFEWDYLYDSLIIAASGGVLTVAGLLVEKFFKRRQTP